MRSSKITKVFRQSESDFTQASLRLNPGQFKLHYLNFNRLHLKASKFHGFYVLNFLYISVLISFSNDRLKSTSLIFSFTVQETLKEKFNTDQDIEPAGMLKWFYVNISQYKYTENTYSLKYLDSSA